MWMSLLTFGAYRRTCIPSLELVGATRIPPLSPTGHHASTHIPRSSSLEPPASRRSAWPQVPRGGAHADAGHQVVRGRGARAGLQVPCGGARSGLAPGVTCCVGAGARAGLALAIRCCATKKLVPATNTMG